jgi:hypothetical protein
MPTEAKVNKTRDRSGLLLLACALLIGFAAGRSVAEAAGAISLESGATPFGHLREGEGIWVAISMALLGFFVFALFRFLLLTGQRVISLLTGVQTRPGTWITVALLACGMACLIGAVALQWYASYVSASISMQLPQVQLPGAGKGAANTGAISVHGRSSVMVAVTTVALLLSGLAIIAVAIWSSIPPRPASDTRAEPMREGARGWAERGDVPVVQAQSFPAPDRPRE